MKRFRDLLVDDWTSDYERGDDGFGVFVVTGQHLL